MNEPPHDIDAEKGVLSSILLDPNTFSKLILKPSDFYNRQHENLFEYLKEMYVENMKLDGVTILNYIGDSLFKIGGQEYLLELQEFQCTPSHSQHYQDIVLKQSRLRQEIKVLEDGLRVAYRGESASDGVISNLCVPQYEKDKPLHQMGEDFIQDCIDGNVGEFDWWCHEWTQELGKMSSELMLFHAPRSTGKTALMLQWILNAHGGSKRTPLASIEMLKKELLPRMIANLGRVNTYTMRIRGHATQSEIERSKESVDQIKALELCVRDKAMSIDDIRAWAISESRNGIDAIFIDNLLSINDGGVQYQSKTIMYDHFIRRLRDLRDDLKIPIIILAHPNAENQIAWSRDVENFADVILFLINVPDEGIDVGCKTIYNDPLIEGQHVIAKFQKNRQGISPIASLSFNKDYQTFNHVRWER